ncbi:c-type cytochrome [Halarcobacter sp.]|uniref:c-type cytochrome n=1 Tax=Halarcobacter sp. TaxID=2321133 RepID=UPI0029F4D582|nr:c-type cytochrome [Halarcobacter sp.]
MKRVIFLTTILASVAFANPYAKCVACHGANGEKVALGKSKVIKDMTKAEIIESLHGYKNGTYGGALKGMMKGQVNNLSDEDIKAIANQIGK